jgi:hypothetical protein
MIKQTNMVDFASGLLGMNKEDKVEDLARAVEHQTHMIGNLFDAVKIIDGRLRKVEARHES